MGSTISKFPREWAAIVDPLKERVGREADVLVGIGARRAFCLFTFSACCHRTRD